MESAGDRTRPLIDRMIARLRELSLVSPTAILSACPASERGELALAFAEDIHAALSEVQTLATRLQATLTARPGPLAFVGADRGSRVSASVEKGAAWASGLEQRAALAHDLARLWSAAAALVPVLTLAESATRPDSSG